MTDEQSASPACLTLVADLPSGKQLEFILDATHTRKFILGRASEVKIDDPMVSQAHAMVLFQGGSGWKLMDLNSTNGTQLNGVPVKTQMTLQSGDSIGLGGSTLHIQQLVAGEVDVQRTVPQMRLSQWTTDATHPDVFVREIHIEIDEVEKERDVRDIVESDFFRDLRERAERMRRAMGENK